MYLTPWLGQGGLLDSKERPPYLDNNRPGLTVEEDISPDFEPTAEGDAEPFATSAHVPETVKAEENVFLHPVGENCPWFDHSDPVSAPVRRNRYKRA